MIRTPYLLVFKAVNAVTGKPYPENVTSVLKTTKPSCDHVTLWITRHQAEWAAANNIFGKKLDQSEIVIPPSVLGVDVPTGATCSPVTLYPVEATTLSIPAVKAHVFFNCKKMEQYTPTNGVMGGVLKKSVAWKARCLAVHRNFDGVIKWYDKDLVEYLTNILGAPQLKNFVRLKNSADAYSVSDTSITYVNALGWYGEERLRDYFFLMCPKDATRGATFQRDDVMLKRMLEVQVQKQCSSGLWVDRAWFRHHKVEGCEVKSGEDAVKQTNGDASFVHIEQTTNPQLFKKLAREVENRMVFGNGTLLPQDDVHEYYRKLRLEKGYISRIWLTKSELEKSNIPLRSRSETPHVYGGHILYNASQTTDEVYFGTVIHAVKRDSSYAYNYAWQRKFVPTDGIMLDTLAKKSKVDIRCLGHREMSCKEKCAIKTKLIWHTNSARKSWW
eukprot:PhF_6_TR25393/c0_g1_i1/m.35112